MSMISNLLGIYLCITILKQLFASLEHAILKLRETVIYFMSTLFD